MVHNGMDPKNYSGIQELMGELIGNFISLKQCKGLNPKLQLLNIG